MPYIIRLAVLFSCLVFVQSADCALTDDLVGLYGFENNFLDTSGSGASNHGTPVNNPGFTPGIIGTAMNLSGVRDYMSLNPLAMPDLDFGNSDTGTDTDFSMAMWIRQADFLSDPAVLSNKDWGDGGNTGINWAPKGNGVFDFNVKGSSGARHDLDTVSNSWPLTVGAWNLVVMSVGRDSVTDLYINGIQRGTIPLTSTGTFNGGLPWNIGQDGTGNYGVEFTGAVDELAIWRRAIDSTEADQLWNSGDGINLADQIVETVLKLVVDRETGRMIIQNNTGLEQDLIGYQTTSAAGAFDQTHWDPVSGRLDASGDGSLDLDDNWIVGTAADSVSDFIELSLGTGTLVPGDSIDLGPGTWARFYEEHTDVLFQYADGVGDELITGAIEFVGGGNDPFPFEFGDLDFDGGLDGDDWLRLQAGFGSSLAALSEAQRYRTSDLNNDGFHTLDDILVFRTSYDAIHGSGAFLAMAYGQTVPEPNSLVLLILSACLAMFARRHIGALCLLVLATVLATVLVIGAGSSQAADLFTETFDSLVLGPSVDENPAGTDVWANIPPAGWNVDNLGLPGGGVTEWRGWAFTDPAWWSEVAGDQSRSQFTKGSGAIAVADPDEWDDLPRDPGLYDTFLETPAISLAGIAQNTVQLQFDSSWRPEDTQTANVTVSFDGGGDVELLHWTSVSGSNFKPDATNETVTIPVNNPAGAGSMQLKFGMLDAGNDWWWAIDNVEVFSPLTLEVNESTGEMKILGDSSVAITGYEVNSPDSSLDPSGWLAGNLDAQEVGNGVSADADFNASDLVDGIDLDVWESAFGNSNAGDSDGDGDSDGYDFLRWQRAFGSTSTPESTWQSFLAEENRLIESYLEGSSTFATAISIGDGYDTTDNRQDLKFFYTTDANEKLEGVVRYVNMPSGTGTAIPEPATLSLLCLLALGVAGLRRQSK